MQMEIEAGSLIGKREEQQDYYLYRSDEKCSYAILCDGMGGMNGGALASKIAATKLHEDFEKSQKAIPAFLKNEIEQLDSDIFCMKDVNGKSLHAGTTMIAVFAIKSELYWLTAGDSLLFILRGNEMVQVNKEHNYELQLNEMLSYGIISKDQYDVEMKKGKRLISYLGVGNISIFDCNEVPFHLQNNDIIILCSDGVTNTIEKEYLKQLICKSSSLRGAGMAISREITMRNKENQDNATYILMKYAESE